MSIQADSLSLTDFLSKFGIQSHEDWMDKNLDWVMQYDEEEMQTILMDRVADCYKSAMKDLATFFLEEGKLQVSFNIAEDTVEITAPDWDAATAALIETINGHGMFHFEDAEELISSGPYASAKDAVILHVHWYKHWGSIFGGEDPKELFQKELERKSRYL